MHRITFPPNFAGWQRNARRALHSGWAPDEILWEELGDGQPSLDLGEESDPGAGPNAAPGIKVPKAFVDLATRVACHADAERWGLLYSVLWRITHGERHLLRIIVDPAVHRLLQMEKTIRLAVHKMRAFVRFRAVEHKGSTWYVAWFEPEHHIVEINAPFFVDRFAGMRWSILTPNRCAHWDGAHLSFTDGVPRSEAPVADAIEPLWIHYYSHIFNPARVKVHAMQAEMPKRYWKNLTEAAAIPALLQQAPARVNSMVAKSRAKSTATPEVGAEFPPAPVPETTSVVAVREAAAHCKACPLYKHATQTVFGEGPPDAKLILLGEQPGDSEDLAGRPFVGPAGQLLDRALEEAGVDRKEAYVTNLCAQTFVTVHPSSLLRAPDEETRAREYAKFVADLRLVAKRLR